MIYREEARRLARQAIRGDFKPEALHTYADEKGDAIYWRIRARLADGSKWIRPMRRNGKGCELGEPDFPSGKPLYGLHALAAKPGAPCWYVEGENCADALAKLGLLATTAGSASSDESADYAPLAGRAVTIWPDNDKPGLEHAERVAVKLRALGCNVEKVDAAALDLPEGGDCVNWLMAHQDATPADLAKLPRVRAEVHASAPAGAAHEWPEPQPLLSKISPEPYPLDALPVTIRAAVEEVQAFTKAPASLVAASALGALSVAAQALQDVKRAERLQGPSSLSLLTIADSGERKTTCDGFFTQAIRDYELEQAELKKPDLARHAAEFSAWEAERDGILAAIKQAGKNKEPTETLRADLVELENAKPQAPRVPELIRGDDTPENLAWVLVHKWPSAGVMSSEAGAVLGAHGMGAESMMRNLALLNILWDGGTHRIGRRTKESYTVRGARLTVGLQVQEATLRSFIEKSDGLARGTGWLSRFLVAWPETTQGARPFSEAPQAWPALEAFNVRIRALLETPTPLDADGALSPAILTLAPEAKAAWVAFHDAIEAELGNGGELFDVKDVAAKAADNAARMAALFQVLEHGVGGTLELAAFKAAGRIVAWHLSEARRFFGELALPVELANAARLDTWLIEHCRRERTHIVARRVIQRNVTPARLREKAALSEALRELSEAGRIRELSDGKKKDIYVNPALLSLGAA